MKDLLSTLSIFFFFAAFSFSQEKTYTAKDSEIAAVAGENFSVSLESNQSTGYSWSVGMVSDNSQVVITGMDYDLPENAKTGEGGAEVWHLKAVAPGTVKLMFYYARSWEKEVPVNTISYIVNIK